MIFMHQCPHCAEAIGTEAWRVARAVSVSCPGCGTTAVPSAELRRVAQRLLRIRKEVELEHTMAANADSDSRTG